MNWYSAKLVFKTKILKKEIENGTLREESIRILKSTGIDAAKKKAAQIGMLAEHQYLNEHGEVVFWKFISVLDVQELDDQTLIDGSEVYSTINSRI